MFDRITARSELNVDMEIIDAPETLGVDQSGGGIVVDVTVGGGSVNPAFRVDVGLSHGETASRVFLESGETTRVTVSFNPRSLATFNDLSPGDTTPLIVQVLDGDISGIPEVETSVEWVEGDGSQDQEEEQDTIDPGFVEVVGCEVPGSVTEGDRFDVSATVSNDNDVGVSGSVTWVFDSGVVSERWSSPFQVAANNTQRTEAVVKPDTAEFSLPRSEYSVSVDLSVDGD